MTTLATLTQQFEALCDKIDSNDGLVPEDLLELFTDLQASHQEKCSAYVALLKVSQMNAAYYSARAEQLKQRAKMCETVEKSLKERLKYNLEQSPDLPWKTADGDRISLRDSPESLNLKILTSTRSFSKVIEPICLDQVPLEFIDVVTIKCLNTEKVKKHLQAGNELDWAELKRDKHVRVT